MRFYEKPTTNAVEEMLEKYRIQELISYERFCRDNALWRQMKTCFSSDSRVKISWYSGSGEGFVEASMKMKAKAPHKLNNSIIWLNQDKAAIVTMACIQSRKEIDGIVYDLTSYVRFLFQCIKENDEWKIFYMTSVYEKDSLVPATPLGIDLDKNGREPYINLSAVLGAEGYKIAQDLPGDDMPKYVEELISQTKQWLQ